jgi:hypothetical protein
MRCLLLPCIGWAQATPSDSKRAAGFMAELAAGSKVLLAWYVEETGLWKTTNWWYAANAITVLGDYAKLTDTPAFFSSHGFTILPARGGCKTQTSQTRFDRNPRESCSLSPEGRRSATPTSIQSNAWRSQYG